MLILKVASKHFNFSQWRRPESLEFITFYTKKIVVDVHISHSVNQRSISRLIEVYQEIRMLKVLCWNDFCIASNFVPSSWHRQFSRCGSISNMTSFDVGQSCGIASRTFRKRFLRQNSLMNEFCLEDLAKQYELVKGFRLTLLAVLKDTEKSCSLWTFHIYRASLRPFGSSLRKLPSHTWN